MLLWIEFHIFVVFLKITSSDHKRLYIIHSHTPFHLIALQVNMQVRSARSLFHAEV